MKILELRFKNLNSLYGEWRIDFTVPEYMGSGIFALTGSTGAGKSTILDAVCLALYGATPRLGKITKSGNEIMSRQTGECYAEVLFESQAGRFRCHWEQQRARKKVNGNLQDQEHQIIDAATGKPLETKKSLVTGIIEEKTGMNFDRFTRSMLLAQGGFDTFLKADIEDKSKILEQITGTGIYSEISKQVHERQRNEQEKLHLLQAEISGIAILGPEQVEKLQSELAEKQQEEIAAATESAESGKAIKWLVDIENLNKEIKFFTEDAVKLQNEIEAFKPDRNKLELATKAAMLDGLYATLVAARKQQAKDLGTQATLTKSLPELAAALEKQDIILKSAEGQLVKAREELKVANPLIQNIRALDLKRIEQEKTVREKEKELHQEAAQIEIARQALEKEKKKRSPAEKKLALTNSYLVEQARDEWLLSGLGGLEEQMGLLLAMRQEILQIQGLDRQAEEALTLAAKKYTDCFGQCIARKQKLEKTTEILRQRKTALDELLAGRLLREYYTEKETLLREMAFLNRITELEVYRAKLEDGKPCPLCGAKEHPFAQGNIPVPDETEKNIEVISAIIAKVEELETTIKESEKAEKTALLDLTNSEKSEAAAENEKKAAEKTLAGLKERLTGIQAGFERQKQAAATRLQPLGITEIPEDHIAGMLEFLQARLSKWQEETGKKAALEKLVDGIDNETKRLAAILGIHANALEEKQKQLTAQQEALAVICRERGKLYGDKNPNTEELRLNKAVSDTEDMEKKHRTMHSELSQQLNTARTNAESLEQRLKQGAAELKTQESDLMAALNSIGFSDEAQFLNAKLAGEEQNSLSARAKNLDNRRLELQACKKDRENRLADETARKITDKKLEDLEPQFKVCEEMLKQLREAIAGLKHQLQENDKRQKCIRDKQEIIAAQRKECQRWDRLHHLIGSADGKKYRNFAQGLTFEIMISHANRQLEKMTDRYLLVRDAKSPLELNVIDNYQAGEIRSTKNLSGGESFIVSLTLALGLSQMASRKVRVDSLFLDEGFGTLDEDALETALEALSGLQQDGKLIGVISHVSALKERIGTQINITPVSGGRSILTGPGCCKLVKEGE
jgi:exonuclease SbcC